ncbi:MAG: insulinase family protein [Bacteroidia bacterium]
MRLYFLGVTLLLAQPQLVFQDSVRQVYVYQLKNGFTVVASPNPTAPQAFVVVATRAGSKQDPPSHTGLAHYLEHMLFKGTDRLGTLAYDKEKPLLDTIEVLYELYNRTTDSLARLAIYKRIDSVAQLAAQWAIPNEYDRLASALGASGTNAFTTFDVTAYINTIPASHVEALLRLESERFRNPVLRLFHTELEAVYEEKNISLDNEIRELSDKVYAALFPDHPYGTQTTIGTIAHLKNPSISAIKRYYATYYVPNNMALIVVGDIVPQRVAEWADRYFGDFPARPLPPFPYPKGGPSPLRKKVRVEVTGPKPPSVQLAFRLPPVGTPAAQAALLLDQILSNSAGGLLDELLVQTRKVQSAGSHLNFLADHTVHIVYAEPRPGQSLEEVEKLLWEALREVAKGKFGDSLLSAAINSLLLQQAKRWRENTGRAYELLDIFVKERPWAEGLYAVEALRRLSRKDLLTLLKTYYRPKACVVAYKRQGERPFIPKVPKPPITPLPIRRKEFSAYATTFLEEARQITPKPPRFAHFDSIFDKSSLYGRVPFYALRNTDDSLFTLIWYLPIGSHHDKWLPLILRYYEHVSPRGMTLTSFKRQLFMLGGELEVHGGDLETYVVLRGFRANLLPLARLVDSLLHTPQVDENMWAFIRANTLKSRADLKEDPGAIQSFLIAYALYGSEHPRKHIPSAEELKLMTAEELVRRATELWRYPWELYYDGPDGAEAAYALRAVLRVPAEWQVPPTPRLYKMLETPLRKAYFVHFPMVRALLAWVHRSVGYQRPLFPLVRYFTEYFGGSMSSLVFQQIREAKGLAYSARAYFVAPGRPDAHYYFLGMISTQADKLVEAYQAMESLIDTPLVEPNLAHLAREALQKELAADRVAHEEVFYRFWEARRLGLAQDRRADLWEALPYLDEKDLRDFHEGYLRGKPRLLLLVGDRNRLPLEVLRSYGLTLEELSKEELFGY